MLDGQLGRHFRVEIGSVDAERVKVGDVVTTNLERTNEELYLEQMKVLLRECDIGIQRKSSGSRGKCSDQRFV